jgi:hypothetical protein
MLNRYMRVPCQKGENAVAHAEAFVPSWLRVSPYIGLEHAERRFFGSHKDTKSTKVMGCNSQAALLSKKWRKSQEVDTESPYPRPPANAENRARQIGRIDA